VLRVYVQAHLDLLLLAVIREEPGGGDAVMRRLCDASGGRFTPSAQSVYPALHRLERNRLVQRSGAGRRRYRLTPSGRRSLAMKQKEWEAFTKGVQMLLE
jgi:PadR family transcriptional regulator, regulatory protein PadR